MAPRPVAHEDRPLSDAEMGVSADRPLSDAEMGDGPGVGESLLRGGAQGVTLNHADELTGAGGALLDKLRGAHEALGELYVKHRDESRRNYKAAEEANPIAYGGAQIAGGIAPMLIPGVGELGVAGRIAAAAGAGALAGEGASEATDARGLIKDAAVSGLVGGAAGAAGEALAGAAGRVANRLAPRLQGAADKATVVSAYGKAGLRKVDDVAQEAGFLRDSGMTGPLSTPSSVAAKAGAAIDEGNAARVAALQDLDVKAGLQGPTMTAAGPAHVVPTGNSIAQHLEDNLLTPLRSNPNRTGAQESAIGRTIRQYRELGDAPISFDQADVLSRQAAAAANPNAPGIQGQIAKQIRGHMLDRAGLVDEGLAGEVGDLGKTVSRLHDVSDLASAAPEAGFQMPHSVSGAVLGAVKSRLPALKGSTFDKLAAVARTNPAALGKWGGYLAQAAARGPAALSAAHYALSQTDSDYAATARAALEGGHE